VQHAIRAFTAKDAKNVKATASTFPESEHVDIAKSLTTLGIGEALVTVLDSKGVPTAVASTQILAPCSSMTTIDDATYQRAIAASAIAAKYAQSVNRESAHEILQRKLEEAATVEEPAPPAAEESDDFAWRRSSRAPARRTAAAPRPRQSAVERTVQTMARQATRTVTQQLVRGIFGMLKGK
jgi:uncharacterized protein